MRAVGVRGGLGLALGIAFASVGTGQEQEQEGPAISARVEDAVEARVAAGSHASIVVGLTDGRRRATFCVGHAAVPGDGELGEEVSPRHVCEIGSISKVFTGIALARMVLEDGLSLDDPVADFLPDGVTVPSWQGEPIRLIHLSTHHSALPGLPDNFQAGAPDNPYADYSVAQLHAFLSSYQLPRPIDQRGVYSNLGVGLLGHALALENECDYEQMIRERITAELGMEDTGVSLEGFEDRIARAHVGRRPVPYWDIPTLAGAGALRSTLDDMLSFVEANMAAAAGERNDALGEALRLSHEPRRPFLASRIGLGWIVLGHGEEAILWHNGGTGGSRSFAGFRAGRGAVVLSASSETVDDIGIHLLDDRRSIGVPSPPLSIEREVLRSYCGEYPMDGATMTIDEHAGQLQARLSGQSWFVLVPVSETDFVIPSVRARLLFHELEDGGRELHFSQLGAPEQRVRRKEPGK